jgi:hypothetical protein
LHWRFARRGGSGLQAAQLLERPVEGAIEVALIPGQQGQTLPAIGQSLEDPGQAILSSQVRELVVDIFGAARELIREQAGFDGPDAAQAPAGDGHGLDQIHLDIVGRLELLDVGVEEELELFLGFGGEQDGLGGETVAEAVAGGFRPAFRGGWTSGPGAVGSGGLTF